jgi:hypothetical protein
MPIIKFMSNPLPMEKKEAIAPAVYAEAVKFLHIPHIEVFFEEYDAFWAFGKKETEGKSMACIADGPEPGAEKMEALSASFMKILQTELGKPDLGFTLIYHANDDTHVYVDGELLRDRKARMAAQKKG